jgi:hypothetical protein
MEFRGTPMTRRQLRSSSMVATGYCTRWSSITSYPRGLAWGGVGGFWYTEDFETTDQSGAMGVPLRKDGNSGVYGFADTTVFEDDRGRRMTVFERSIASMPTRPLSN